MLVLATSWCVQVTLAWQAGAGLLWGVGMAAGCCARVRGCRQKSQVVTVLVQLATAVGAVQVTLAWLGWCRAVLWGVGMAAGCCCKGEGVQAEESSSDGAGACN